MGRRSQHRIQISVTRDLRRTPEQATPEAPDVHGHGDVPGEQEIMNAVDRILHSRAMNGCNRLVQLLTFVVNSTLHGEASHLKETTIGVAVFGRAPDYDPKVDTIVRSQAWRLRAKL